MEITVLGIDLEKNRCSVVGLDGTGQVVMRRVGH
jgi:transposase